MKLEKAYDPAIFDLYADEGRIWLELQVAWDLWHTARSPAGKKIARLPRLAKVS